MNGLIQEPPASSTSAVAPAPAEGPSHVPIPSASTTSPFHRSAPLTPVVCDERAIGRLLETLLKRGGLSISEAARRLGVNPHTIRQYLNGRRSRPSLIWFVKLAALCGAKVTVEFPSRH